MTKSKTKNEPSNDNAAETFDKKDTPEHKDSDLQFYGNPDQWKLICKEFSKSENWMKSTKAMDISVGCLVQVTTQQGANVAEAVTFVPNVKLIEDEYGANRIVRHGYTPRKLTSKDVKKSDK